MTNRRYGAPPLTPDDEDDYDEDDDRILPFGSTLDNERHAGECNGDMRRPRTNEPPV
jgi:hypothetical protein